jgi:cyclohexa-1,5-dienecarbonyl-CoA hydratase
MSQRVSCTVLDNGAIWRVAFGHPPGNILDVATLSDLSRVFQSARTSPRLAAVCLEGVGGHFSYGASVQEHLPGQVAAMLAAIRTLAFDMLDSNVVLVAAIRGRCLGGGLEVACLCHHAVAASDATFGQPEIALGVFAPIASVVLPERLRRADAEDLCLTGRTVNADEARTIGLIQQVSQGDPMDDALLWVRTHLGGRSARSLRVAARAIRWSLSRQLREVLPELERLYLDDLMASHDAAEGINAFLEKRSPAWRHN